MKVAAGFVAELTFHPLNCMEFIAFRMQNYTDEQLQRQEELPTVLDYCTTSVHLLICRPRDKLLRSVQKFDVKAHL